MTMFGLVPHIRSTPNREAPVNAPSRIIGRIADALAELASEHGAPNTFFLSEVAHAVGEHHRRIVAVVRSDRGFGLLAEACRARRLYVSYQSGRFPRASFRVTPAGPAI